MNGELPSAVQEGLGRMAMGRVHFAPIRHHSPACSLALQAMVRELRPAAILIEGPDSFDALLPLLTDARTRPPVAILSVADAGVRADGADAGEPGTAAFFPLCAYSPEMVGLHLAHEVGAAAAFIDLPWDVRATTDAPDAVAGGDQASTLMAERHLAHSRYVQALARASGCRGQDELWDHLFELRPSAAVHDWRGFFADVFVYCALARADYEPAVLEAEGSAARERHMAAHLRRHRARLDAEENPGAIVVICGGFHAIALQQLLSEAGPPAADRGRAARTGTPRDWLIRYSFDRLDALNGYAAGMPSPAWHQWVWEDAQAGDDLAQERTALRAIAGFARQGRERGLADQASTADIQAAMLQAVRLAQLRGHAGPGRDDVLDALRSCLVKGAIDDGNAELLGDLRRYLAGSALGDIPPSAGSPPLLEDARRRARVCGVRLADSDARAMRLDLYRKEGHRRRSRFLHLMDYLGAGVGQRRAGPDFAAGTGLDLLIEEWHVAWTPLVEARLVELASEGPTLDDVAMARLRREEAALAEQGQARSAGAAVNLLVRACVIGLHDRLPGLMSMLVGYLAEDPDLGSVTACAHALLALWRAREPLGVQDHAATRGLLTQAWRSSLALLPDLDRTKPEQEADAVRNLVTLRAVCAALTQPALAETAPGNDHGRGAWHGVLVRLADARQAPGVALAAGALLFLDGAWDDAALGMALGRHFGPGADADHAVRALGGMMAAGPELLLTQPQLRADLDRIIGAWDEPTFIRYLPDLRLAFAQLKPRETSQLAHALSNLHAGLDEALADVHYDLSEADLLAGTALEANLVACLQRDGLAALVAGAAR